SDPGWPATSSWVWCGAHSMPTRTWACHPRHPGAPRDARTMITHDGARSSPARRGGTDKLVCQCPGSGRGTDKRVCQCHPRLIALGVIAIGALVASAGLLIAAEEPAVAEGFAAQVAAHFESWDLDRDGSLSFVETSRLVPVVAIRDEAAAAL